MKSVVNKSGNKVYIIQQTDKKIPLETIAKNKGWRLDEMLEEMETIAASGTKLNLDYAIDEMLDEYEQEEIIEYFKGCETSSLQVAQEELADGNFNWEQLKIMRIKFLSAVWNVMKIAIAVWECRIQKGIRFLSFKCMNPLFLLPFKMCVFAAPKS